MMPRRRFHRMSDLAGLRNAELRRWLMHSHCEPLESRRLLDATDLDTAFSGDGKLLINSGTEASVRAMAVQSDGKVLFAGSSKLPTQTVQLFRYNPNGTPDTTFSGDG